MFPYERELLPAKQAEKSPGFPLLSLLIFTDSFWWGLFFLGLYAGTKERRGIPQVHPPEQRQHAWSSKPYEGARAASERLVHWCNDSIEGFVCFPLCYVVIQKFVNMLRRHLKFCHLLSLKWYTCLTPVQLLLSGGSMGVTLWHPPSCRLSAEIDQTLFFLNI